MKTDEQVKEEMRRELMSFFVFKRLSRRDKVPF